jgi:hypothetical protein
LKSWEKRMPLVRDFGIMLNTAEISSEEIIPKDIIPVSDAVVIFKEDFPGNYIKYEKNYDQLAEAQRYETVFKAWDGKISKIILSYGFSEFDIEDIKQRIFMEFYARRYLDIFDANRSNGLEGERKGKVQFSTFMYSFIIKRLLGQRTKNLKDHCKNAISYDSTIYDNEDTVADLIFSKVDDMGAKSQEDTILWNIEFEKTKAALHNKFRGKGVVVKKRDSGEMQKMERSYENLLILIEGGYTKKEIALIFDYSEASVALMIKELSAMPEVIHLLGVL